MTDLTKLAEWCDEPDWLKSRISRDEWHPEYSDDDCDPLFEVIERRNLWEPFIANLVANDPPKHGALMARWCFMREPRQIVEAFCKTMEEATCN